MDNAENLQDVHDAAIYPSSPQIGVGQAWIQPLGGVTGNSMNALLGFVDQKASYIGGALDTESAPLQAAPQTLASSSQNAAVVDESVATPSTAGRVRGDADSPAGPRSICPICGKSYSRLSSLTRHVNSEHHSIRYRCSQCPKTYDRPEYVRRHEKSAHRKTSRTPYYPGPRTPQASASPRSTGVSKTRGGKAQQNSSLAKKIERIREKYSLEIQRAIFEDMSQTFDLSGEDMDGLGEE